MKHISAKDLKKARNVENMTQEEVAKLLGINRSYLSMIENGKVKPSLQLQNMIDKIFRKTISRFFFIE